MQSAPGPVEPSLVGSEPTGWGCAAQPLPEHFVGGWRAPASLWTPVISTHAVLQRNPAAAERCQEIHMKYEEVFDVAAAIEQPQRELNALRQSFRDDFATPAPNHFKTAPWLGLGRTPADALASNSAQQAAIRTRMERLKQTMQRQLAVLEAKHEWLRQREADIHASARLSPIRLSDLPSHLLRRAIGLDGMVFDTAEEGLLHHTSRCAKVCSEWRQLVLHDPAYGGGLSVDARSDCLAEISDQLSCAQRLKVLCLDNLGWKWLEDGADSRWRIVAAALRALPVPLPIRDMHLACSGLSAVVAPQLSLALARDTNTGGYVRVLALGGNPLLGDSGLAALVPSLSGRLVRLMVNECNIGDAGVIALAGVLPSKVFLRRLDVGYNREVTVKGWAALGEAVGKMVHLEELYCAECSGMKCEGVAALVAHIPASANLLVGGSHLSKFDLSKCGIKDEGAKIIASMLERCVQQVDKPRSILRSFSGLSVWGNPFVSSSGKDVLVSAITKLRQRQQLLEYAEIQTLAEDELPEPWAQLRMVLYDPDILSDGSSSDNEGPEMWDPEIPGGGGDVSSDIADNDDTDSSGDDCDEDDDNSGSAPFQDGSGISDGGAHHLVDDVAVTEATTAVFADNEHQTDDHVLQGALQASASAATGGSPSTIGDGAVAVDGFSPIQSSGQGSDSDADTVSDNNMDDSAAEHSPDVHTARGGSVASDANDCPSNDGSFAALDETAKSRAKKRRVRVVMDSDEDSA